MARAPKGDRRRVGATPSGQPLSVESHAHCVVCGRSIAAGEGFCSTTCEQTLAEQRRRQRRTSLIFLGFLAVLMVVWLLIFSRSVG